MGPPRDSCVLLVADGSGLDGRTRGSESVYRDTMAERTATRENFTQNGDSL